MNSVKVYYAFSGLKAHFTQNNYDYIKYNGKTKYTNYDKFCTHKFQQCFITIARKYEREYFTFLLFNFMRFPFWQYQIINFIQGNCHELYSKWHSKLCSSNYIFKKDLEYLLKYHDIRDINIELLMNYYEKNQIFFLTILIFDSIIPLLDNQYDDEEYQKMVKSKSFFKINPKRYAKIIQEVIGE